MAGNGAAPRSDLVALHGAHGVATVGAASIVTTLRGAGHDTDFLDLYFERNVPRAIKKAVGKVLLEW